MKTLNFNFFQENDMALSLMMDDRSLKVMLVQFRKDKPVLVACDQSSIDTEVENGLPLLSSMLKKTPGQLRSCVLILKREDVLLRNFSIPSSDPKSIDKILATMIPQQIPYEVSEIIKHYSVIRQAEGMDSVTLTVAHRRVLETKLQKLEKMSVIPDKVVYSSAAILECFRRGQPAEEEGIAVLDVDENDSEMIISIKDEVVTSRKISAGKDDYAEGNPAIFSRIYKELDFLFQQTPELKKKITRVIITGLFYPAPPLEQQIAGYFGIAPTLFSLQEQEGIPFSITPLWGGILMSDLNTLNLLPEEIKKRKVSDVKFSKLNQVLRGLSLLLALLLCFSISHLGAKGIQNLLLSHQTKAYQRKLGNLQDFAVSLRIKKRHESKKYLLLDFLAELHKILPSTIEIGVIEFDLTSRLTLRGISEKNENVTEFMNLLKRIPFVSDLTLDYSQFRSSDELGQYDFQIHLNLEARNAL